jgi:hypothetical protein
LRSGRKLFARGPQNIRTCTRTPPANYSFRRYNTTDHTWELLQTPGITKEEQRELFRTDKQIVMEEVLEPWWGKELKYQPSVMFPEYNSKVTENTKWAESALIAGIPVYQSGSMKKGPPK